MSYSYRMIEEARLIFRELYDEARALAIATFEGPADADEDHPCHYLVPASK